MTMTAINHLSTKTVSQIAGLSVSTLNTWRYDKKGPPYIKKGGLVFYPLDELLQYLENGLHVVTQDFTKAGYAKDQQYTHAIAALKKHYPTV